MNVIYNIERLPPQRFSLKERAPAASFEEERLHRKQRLAATFRLFARAGFDQGLAGHVTARDPEFPDQFWINPLGRYSGQIRVSDLQLIDHEGNILIGNALPAKSVLHPSRRHTYPVFGCLCRPAFDTVHVALYVPATMALLQAESGRVEGQGPC